MFGLMMIVVSGGAYWMGNRNAEPGFSLPPGFIAATSTDGSESFTIATGRVTGDAEGLFVLDHETGLLQCFVMYPKSMKFGAQFTANVGDALAGRGEKGAHYVLVTGDVNFRGTTRNMQPGGTVCYVLDTTSGNLVAYGMPFDHTMMTAGRPQNGILTPLDMRQTRVLAIRE